MYKVVQRGMVIKQYDMFLDAWLYIVLELVCYARIVGPDGRWTINPIRTHIN